MRVISHWLSNAVARGDEHLSHKRKEFENIDKTLSIDERCFDIRLIRLDRS